MDGRAFWQRLALPILLVGGLGLMAWSAPLKACTFCGDTLRSRATWRQQMAQAAWVFYGTLANPRYDPVREQGTTEFRVQEVLKGEAAVLPPGQLLLPVYLPVIGNATPREYVVLGQRRGQNWEVTGGFPANAATVEYLKKLLRLPAEDVTGRCAFFLQYLDHPEAAVALDAFVELGRTSDADLYRAALQGAFTPQRLRQLLQSSQLPDERRGVLAFLLGLCGEVPGDAEFLYHQWRRRTTTNPPVSTENTPAFMPSSGDSNAALSGLLTGLILLDPPLGWRQAEETLRATDSSFRQRWAVVETLRFLQSFRPPPLPTETDAKKRESAGVRRDHRRDILRCCQLLIQQGDLADQTIEDLRRWGWWDLTAEILAHFEHPTHQAPIVRRAIVRYALTAPGPQAREFIERLRQREPELVRSVEQFLRQWEPADNGSRR
ncbi:MAG: hypothetical protein RMJ88_14190 [Thermogemmata sp.]|nr:hypothetical protein [Thermogemmata sp.]